jgi:hypothetical protein
MPGLTVTEKEHWRQRVSARISKRIESIKGRHPALFERVKREARARALQSLGLAEAYATLEQVQADAAALERRRTRAQRTMLAVVRGVPIDEISDSINIRYGRELPLPHEAAEALDRRQEAHEEELLADDPVGAEIAHLKAERERLLDTVWLACSSAQIKQLWSKVSELLGDEGTPLEREVLAIAPIKEE